RHAILAVVQDRQRVPEARFGRSPPARPETALRQLHPRALNERAVMLAECYTRAGADGLGPDLENHAMEQGVWKLIFVALSAVVCWSGALADPVADFYRNRQISIIVGYGAGGGYDLYARLVARHLGRHIPGEPSIIVQNMPGAGSLAAAN